MGFIFPMLCQCPDLLCGVTPICFSRAFRDKVEWGSKARGKHKLFLSGKFGTVFLSLCRIVSDMYLVMLCNPAQMATVWQNTANQNKVNCYRLLLQVIFFFFN